MIYKIHHRESPFVQIDKELLKDPRMSWKAKGLLCYLLSCPNDWRPMAGQLQSISTDGKDAVRSALKELQAFGYAKLTVMRNEETGAIEGTRWDVYEEPREAKTLDGENPNVGKPAPTNKVSENNKEKKTNKDGSAKASPSKFQKPSLEEVKTYAKEIQLSESEAEKFFLNKEANGWTQGKVPLKNWKPALQLWKRNRAEWDQKESKASYKSSSAQPKVLLKDISSSIGRARHIANLMSNDIDEVHLGRLDKSYRPMIAEAVAEHGETAIKALFKCVSPDRVEWLFPTKGNS